MKDTLIFVFVIQIFIFVRNLSSTVAGQVPALRALRISLPVDNPSYYLLCLIWAAPSSNWAALRATVFVAQLTLGGFSSLVSCKVFLYCMTASLPLLLPVTLPAPSL